MRPVLTHCCAVHTAHLQDTGGFFIAVLQKVAPTPPLEDPKMGHRWVRLCASALPPVLCAVLHTPCVRMRRAWWGSMCLRQALVTDAPSPSVLLLLV